MNGKMVLILSISLVSLENMHAAGRAPSQSHGQTTMSEKPDYNKILQKVAEQKINAKPGRLSSVTSLLTGKKPLDEDYRYETFNKIQKDTTENKENGSNLTKTQKANIDALIISETKALDSAKNQVKLWKENVPLDAFNITTKKNAIKYWPDAVTKQQSKLSYLNSIKSKADKEYTRQTTAYQKEQLQKADSKNIMIKEIKDQKIADKNSKIQHDLYLAIKELEKTEPDRYSKPTEIISGAFRAPFLRRDIKKLQSQLDNTTESNLSPSTKAYNEKMNAYTNKDALSTTDIKDIIQSAPGKTPLIVRAQKGWETLKTKAGNLFKRNKNVADTAEKTTDTTTTTNNVVPKKPWGTLIGQKWNALKTKVASRSAKNNESSQAEPSE